MAELGGKPSAVTGGLERIASIDALRGLTILVMIFVNDVAGVVDVPWWMEHFFPYDADGMTFVDVVFPAFLFIVGMSIPFAIGRRLDRGEAPRVVWGHVALRTLWMLVIGVLMVNGYVCSDEGLLNREVWTILMYLGIVLAWNTVPKEPGRARRVLLGLRWAGIALLAFLVVVYRSKNADGVIQLRTSWWGIIGLIGWAYLVACIAYGFLRRNLAGLVGAMALMYCLYAADKVGTFDGLLLRGYLDFGSHIGGHGGIAIAGVILGIVVGPNSPVPSPRRRMQWAFLFGVAMVVAGWLIHRLAVVHPMFIVNKNAATPSWGLYCSAITAWIWIPLYWTMDVKGWTRWAAVIRPAGENPLFAYILHPMLIHMFAALALVIGVNPQAKLGGSFAMGFTRAVVTAFAITWFVGFLKDRGVRLKL
ncbi:MAG: heparan-alpha-glucosaminide N-acetyltransferase [Candidatus Sumerlaeota bacterium]|nr:heparan-alpha-glucosaminide N-acetyltransferase [Candidatus Sumerlaeota bacterium]